MKKIVLAVLVAAFAAAGPALASEKFQDRYPIVEKVDCGVSTSVDGSCYQLVAQATTTTPGTVIVTPATPSVGSSQPATTTTVTVKGGDLAAKILDWFWVAFGGTLGLLATAVLYKIFGYFGIQTTDIQRAQLQSIIVNGLNAGAAKAQVSLHGMTELDFTAKNQIIADAVIYAQNHAAETIKALGLDPKSGEAVEAIKARIETALNDPMQPTPPAITPESGKLSA